MSVLPEPGRDRWQPLRVGLVNLFHYDEEIFPFCDGHLLLRGNNGTGKSKVLALTLPFLLDGRLAPARVEPDGDPGKRMEWNLLLGGKHSERQGYAWIEFGRLDADGTARTLTAGCGLRAVAERPVQSWFFVTDQRIGEALSLIDSHDRTLGRDRLKEALAGRGEVYDQAARYRRALDEALFHLGEPRYEALIQLLIQLRQPQLSKRPDERALSHALTEALPPLDQGVLADVAEAFRNLDAERDELAALEDTRTAVEQFLHHYRAYARIAGRRRAREVRQAQSRYEKLGSELGQRHEALGEALTAERDLARAATEQEEALADARTEADALRAPEAMRSARELELAEQDATKEARRADDAEAEERRLQKELERQGARLAHHRERSQASAERLAGASSEAAAGARAAALEDAHQRILAPLALPDGPEEGPDESLAAGADQQVRALIARRREALAHLQDLNRRMREAEQVHGEARRARQAEADAGRRLELERTEAEQAAQAAGAALVEAVRRVRPGLHDDQRARVGLLPGPAGARHRPAGAAGGVGRGVRLPLAMGRPPPAPGALADPAAGAGGSDPGPGRRHRGPLPVGDAGRASRARTGAGCGDGGTTSFRPCAMRFASPSPQARSTHERAGQTRRSGARLLPPPLLVL